MTRIAIFDCFSGISGDMTLGALLHAGVDEVVWRNALSKLKVPGYDIVIKPVKKEGIAGLQVNVNLHDTDHGHGRHLSDIADILEASRLSDSIASRSMAVFTRLAGAEAKIHGSSPEQIHFHEVGAIDAIVDIVGACIGLDELCIERVYASPLPLTRGWVECAHGMMPVPAPATMELLTGFTLRPDSREKELITPTGAAILSEWAERESDGTISSPPEMRLIRVGYGAGQRESEIPNLLRICIGEV